MQYLMRAILLVFLLCIAAPSGYSQLWNNSEYFQDRINTEQTYFVLSDAGAADFAYAAEWTNETVRNNEERSAIFLWHFKDGTTAYSLLQKFIGDIGKNAGFLVAGRSSHLEDNRRNQIQPLTRDNYPVRAEIWVGSVGDTGGFSPEFMGQAVCFDAQDIEFNHKYYFTRCRSDGKP